MICGGPWYRQCSSTFHAAGPLKCALLWEAFARRAEAVASFLCSRAPWKMRPLLQPLVLGHSWACRNACLPGSLRSRLCLFHPGVLGAGQGPGRGGAQGKLRPVTQPNVPARSLSACPSPGVPGCVAAGSYSAHVPTHCPEPGACCHHSAEL